MSYPSIRSPSNSSSRPSHRADTNFQAVISPSSLLTRPDIIPFSQPQEPRLPLTLTTTPLVESELEHLRQDLSRKAQTTEALQEELARANDLNDKYYDRIVGLEEKLQGMRRVEQERDALAVELRAMQGELSVEREFKYGKEFMGQIRIDLESREREDYEARIKALEVEVEEQRREIQRLLDLGEAYRKQQDSLEQTISALEERTKREQKDRSLFEEKYRESELLLNKTASHDKDRQYKLVELESNLEEVEHHNSQLAKMLKEQQDLNQLLRLKMKETEEVRGENAVLLQRLRTFQANLAEVEAKYERQLADNYQLQVKLRTEKKTKHSIKRTGSYHSSSVDLGETKFSNPGSARVVKTRSTRASLTPKNMLIDESENSYDELDELVQARKAELGLQPPEVVIRYKKPPAKRGSSSFGRCPRRGFI